MRRSLATAAPPSVELLTGSILGFVIRQATYVAAELRIAELSLELAWAELSQLDLDD